MKKTIRNTLLLLLVVVVIGGLIAVLLYNQADEEEAESSAASSEAAETETLLEKEDADIDTITFTSEEGSYVMKAYAEEVEASSSEDSSAAETEETIYFNIAGLEDYAVNTSTVTTAAKTLYNLAASKNLGTQENLDAYGLSGDGEGKAELTYKDGGSDTLIIGSTAGSGSGQYVLLNDTVYVVSTISTSLFASEYSFIDTAIFSVADVEETDEEGNTSTVADLITTLKFSGVNLSEPVNIVYDQSALVTYKMTSPMECDASADKISTLTETLKSLTASQVVLPGYTEDDLADYGLSEPYATVEFIMNGESHRISVSESDTDGNCYLIADDINMIYQIAWSSVSDWAELTLTNLRSSYIMLPNIQEVSKITLVQGDAETVLEVTRTKDEENSTEDSIKYILTITSGGADIDYDTVYQPFYKELISMSLLSAEKADYASDTPVLTVTYEYFEGGSDTMTFFEITGQERYAVEVNGAFNGVLRKSTLDAVIEQIAPTAANEAGES